MDLFSSVPALTDDLFLASALQLNVPNELRGSAAVLLST